MNYHKLKGEVLRWQNAGIINAEQGMRILALYEQEVPVYKTMRFWLLSLAVVLLGFALFLIISVNWQHLHYLVQSLIGALPLVAAQGYAVRSELREERFNADLGWFAASIAFGANIMLQAQIFHISAYYPNGVLFWVLGMLPLLWWRPTTTSYLLASLLLFIYMGMQMQHRQFSVLATLPLMVLARTVFLRQTMINTLALFVTLYLFASMVLSYRQWQHPGMLWELSLLLLALALLQKLSRLSESSFSILLSLVALGFYLIALIATFEDGARWLIGKDRIWLPAIIITLAGLSLYQMRRELREARTTLIIASAMGLLSLFGFIGHAAETAAKSSVLFVRIGANLIYVASLVVLLFHAIHLRAKKLFLSAATGLLLWIWIRYLDLFHDYLVTALIFALSALALVSLNKMWERKYERQ